VRDLLEPINLPNVVERFKGWAKPSVKAEDFILNHRCYWQIVEEVGKQLPDSRALVLPNTLVIEPIHLCDLPALMIPPCDRNSIREPDLQHDQERKAFHAVIPTIYIVTHKQIVRIRWLPSNPEKLHQVMKLAMDIPTDRHRGWYILYIGLLCQDFLRFLTNCLNVGFWELFVVHQEFYLPL
jgi:hypothetical protein